MASPDAARPPPTTSPAPFASLLARELRALFLLRPLYALLFIGGPLAGLSMREALALFADASRASSDIDTLDGVVVPTLGALYLSTTLLFPFVVIRLLGDDKRNATWTLLTQLGYRTSTIVLAKALVLDVAIALSALPALSCVAAFALAGGHVHLASLGAVLLGHALYAGVVVGVGVVAVAVTDGGAGASLFTLAATVGMWALEVVGARESGVVGRLATFVPTAALRVFEHGLIDVRIALVLLVVAVALAVAGAFALSPSAPLERNLGRAVVVVVVAVAVAAAAAQVRRAFDVTESRRNSFPRGVEAQLHKIGDPIRVSVRLRPEDPRAYDLEREVLGPLSRAAVVEVKRIDVDDRTYGLITYQVGTRGADSRSTAPEEVLPLVFQLAGLPNVAIVDDARPTHTQTFTRSVPAASGLAFVLWPLVALVGMFLSRRRSAS